jgi:hypothetical protein
MVLLMTERFDLVVAQQPEKYYDKIIGSSEMIVVGKVQSKKCEWNKDKSRIFTRVNISVDEYVKGVNASQEITVMHWGGEIDGVGELYTHTVSFKSDEHVFLFLKKDKNENLRVNGGQHGKMTISKDEKSVHMMVNQSENLEKLKDRIKSMLDVKRK